MNDRQLARLLGKVPYKLSVYQILRERSILESSDYVQEHLSSAMLFESSQSVWTYAAKSAHLQDGLNLEFGVYKGKSINHFAKLFAPHKIHGFDSFEGLAEDWTGYHLPEGTFDLGGKLPKVHDNVVLHKGWFDSTLPAFLDTNSENIRLCHIDCDTYESSRFVLKALAKRFVAGSVIVFDEYYGYPNWRNGEFKAWQEVCAEHNIEYSYIAFSNMQVALKII
ncbi:class I SAM-dependent methyltransferase [Falsihalocynthiibacter sp. SS001]|uniref:class I SAM-dependent methyltransferase n=1 Tax=Falsihalocynthiibacter sp. SS001 TaxID=3349698 RepID=UPI0036D2CF9B